ncbi:PREDICTED: E2F-associated phosphoprotein-like [Camelina sativa]|uniref:E2F-associated phosphoprotein-like n=1 Tax=Camelina sativa TaxID=90675 RepID=A0ABM0XV55_CAMSA|nr:PREDICTED: E2F-associated phosphoprotein-like [Camelina sativa]
MASPINSQNTVSDDDEIDYSIKPEFYDSDLDDKDDLWMVCKRDGRPSDAVLSCPACFTTVCLECQRHEQYVTQYRAVFVVNCRVDKDTVLQQKGMPSKIGKRRRDSEMQETGSAESEQVNRVFCSACSTEIGVVDSEEIYHFINVIPSEP